MLRRDGTRFPCEISSAIFPNGAGELRTVVIIRDISGRRATESALRESRRLEGIGILAGGMAHEFNNLLTVINGYAGLLSHGFDIHDPAREQIESICVAGERAASLTRQLLAFGQKQMLRPSVLELNYVVEDSRRAWMPLMRKNVRLRMELRTSAGRVSVDPDQLREILVNLVKNAMDAMPGGGELVLGTESAQIDDQHAAAHSGAHSGEYAVLRVADTGVGMDGKTRMHIFEPFFTTKDRATTTGLGLATVYGIVAQHGGWIDVESALGQGSVFRIYFPSVEHGDAPSRAPLDLTSLDPTSLDLSSLELTSGVAGGATILVVEDEDAVRRLTVSILRDHGYHTFEAANGKQAIAAVEGQSQTIDLIVADVIMPGMTGPQLVKRLRSSKAADKVLYVSGYPEEVLATCGLRAGEVSIIQKPYAPELLVSAVRKILGGPGAGLLA